MQKPKEISMVLSNNIEDTKDFDLYERNLLLKKE